MKRTPWLCRYIIFPFLMLQNLSGRKMPQYHRNPRLLPQLMNNWKLVRDEMEYLGMKTMGIEPEGIQMM